MDIRFWQASLKGLSAAKYLVTGLAMLALIIGTLTTSLLFAQPAAAATLAQQHTTGSAQVQSGGIHIAASEMTFVPNVLSWPLGDAENQITFGGLVVGRISTHTGCFDAPDTVIQQNPIGGASVPVGTAVNLTVLIEPSGGCI